jgi:Raf kinase inhibitor-like YbhB/YbcL family protein
MHVKSTAFADGAEIPKKYTQDGADVSPPLAFDEIPPDAKSLALVVDDPDAPDPEAPRKQAWVHWVLVDIPPSTHALPEAVVPPPGGPGGHVGKNDWNHTQWDGPAPPVGQHRYRFKLYALDRVLGLAAPTKAELERAMQGHVLDEAELIGTYKRARPG